MRWLFLVIIVILFEALSYGAGRGLQWWASAWLSDKNARWVFWSIIAASHVFLLLAITRVSANGLKIAMSWLTILWIMIMAFIVTAVVMFLVSKIATPILSPAWYPVWGSRGVFLAVFVGLIGWAVYNAYTPTIRHITITANHPMTKPLRLAMVSDLHLGWLVGHRELNKLTEIVKSQKVDMLLMPGDILDDNTSYYDSLKMQPSMRELVQAVPMGVYASLGNHDMYGSEAEIRNALINAGVKVLADETVLVDNQVWVVGRFDNHARNRKATQDLLPQVIDKPVILLDHEPNEIEKNVQSPIDLQLSGHTHNGQIFPANFIIKAINRLGYGHERINNTDVVVSSGYGFWGVPFRLASQSEVWVIDMVGKS